MFCPKCKSEYIEGFTRCSGCDTELVHEIPDESKKERKKLEYIEYEFIMSVFNVSDIFLIKSLMESSNITYFIQGEFSINCTGAAGPARVLVKRDQAEQARILLMNSDFLHTIL